MKGSAFGAVFVMMCEVNLEWKATATTLNEKYASASQRQAQVAIN